jgi:DNA-directed RNA polymerase specialized sigma24 family protein
MSPPQTQAEWGSVAQRVERYARRIDRGNRVPDLAERTMEKLARLARQGRWAGTNEDAWRYKCVLSTYLDAVRKTVEDPAPEPGGDVRIPSSVHDWLALRRAWASLSDEDRRLIWIVDIEGMPIREVAEELGRSEHAAEQRVSVARGRFRAALEREGFRE